MDHGRHSTAFDDGIEHQDRLREVGHADEDVLSFPHAQFVQACREMVGLLQEFTVRCLLPFELIGYSLGIPGSSPADDGIEGFVGIRRDNSAIRASLLGRNTLPMALVSRS